MGTALQDALKSVNKKFGGNIVETGVEKNEYDRIPFSSPRLNYMTFGGLPMGHIIEFSGPEGSGKAQPLDSLVLTSIGYKLMRDIKIGDKVIDGLGNETEVIGVFPQGVKSVYKITFSDRTSTLCSDEHLWKVYDCSCLKKGMVPRERVLTVNELLNYKLKTDCWRFRLPLPVIKCWENNVEIDPYLLGVLLGDGCLNSGRAISVSLYEDDIKVRVSEILNKMGYKLQNKSSKDYIKDYDIVRDEDTIEGFNKFIEKLDLKENSINKHIPKEYLYTTIENRIKLLQGLFDTDGYIQREGNNISYKFNTSSEKLSDDFAFLVRSLGGTDTVTKKQAGYRVGNTYIRCNDTYEHYIKMVDYSWLCSSYKHLNKLKERQFPPYKTIRKIEYYGEQECQCIKVSSLDHTYITNDLIVTHNTTTAIDIMKNAQIKFDSDAKKNGVGPKQIVFIDVEGTFDYTWSSKFGLDTKRIVRLKMAGISAQDILNTILEILDSREVGLVVLDSIASMIPEQLEGKGVGEKIYGGLAQSLQNFSLKAGKYLREDNVMILCMNQVRDNLNSMFGGTITPRWKRV